MSGVSIEVFQREALRSVASFVQWYMAEHEKSPDDFPLELPEDNAGLWWEFLISHMMAESENG